MFASADQVQDEDNDDQNGQGSPNGDRNHVVVNLQEVWKSVNMIPNTNVNVTLRASERKCSVPYLVIIAAFHHTESICVGRHEWLNLKTRNRKCCHYFNPFSRSTKLVGFYVSHPDQPDRAYPEVEGLDRGIEVAGEIKHHSSIAGEGVAFVRVNGLDAIVFLESCRFDFF